MTFQVLNILIAVSLCLPLCLCHRPFERRRDSWVFPFSTAASGIRFGSQIPPHPEPDAILLNAGGNGPPERPGSFPGVFGMPAGPSGSRYPGGLGGSRYPGGPEFPGVFGAPGVGGQQTGRNPGLFGIPGPGVFAFAGGVPQIPTGSDVFGMPGAVPRIPGGPGMFGPNAFAFPNGPGVSNGPAVFGLPGQQPRSMGPGVIFGIPNRPDIFGVPNQLKPEVYGLPNSPPGEFGVPNQWSPEVYNPPNSPPGQFGVPNQGRPEVHSPGGFEVPSQGRPGLSNGPFGAPNGPPGAFPGVGDIPFHEVPGIFIPGRTFNVPKSVGDFPGTRGFEPKPFIPGGANEFNPGGIFPGDFMPGNNFFPVRPDSSGGMSPRRLFYGGDREMHDDPVADIFPIIDKSPLKAKF